MRALRGLGILAVTCACTLGACGDDDKPGTAAPSKRDAGPDAAQGDGGGEAGSGGRKPPRPDAGPEGGRGAEDSGMDAEVVDPPFDAAGDYKDAGLADEDGSGPPPAGWSCPEPLWSDKVCDCGCGARDFDCTTSSCSDPGCMEDSCQACFAVDGTYMSCLPPPDASGWTCDPTLMSNGTCDCGCGIPDPACAAAEGCTSAGCRALGCDFRHGCDPGVTTDAADDCSSNNPSVLSTKWTCGWGAYGGSDGCDCGCGVMDPDCFGDGCIDGRCFDDACTTCHDENGRPYKCEAAEAGWDYDTTDGSPGSLDTSRCNATRFDAADGCDCGCGGIDPDCGAGGCSAFGCTDAACERCTDGFGRPIGCADSGASGAWDASSCDLASYGTGDGCDCGCGAPDPDCDGKGSVNSSFTSDCDFCHDGVGGYDACPAWDADCDDALVANGDCDCGCGVVDPDCRVEQRASCTAPGCELSTCEYCNDGGSRAACGGEWEAADGVGAGQASACGVALFDLDGLCDCGCGADDPDCGDAGCTGQGCSAPGCDVCHDGTLLAQCLIWYCDAASFGTGDGCDCGCGAPDPDCEGAGCTGVGCVDAACEACHDPFGRATPCPE